MKKEKKEGYFWFVIILAGICGKLIGDILGSNVKSLYFLKKVYSIGFTTPICLDLNIIQFTFALKINVNIMSILGIILAIIYYRKY
ncbi:DUF4321 domain-containing protein [Haloimpatiens sp. FM7330]|uniref:DUF4321 domain-containing protein n=1 Tax=Haloimpatiens sp. FM7330 TaxID=3298610 RepID=UPI003627619B